MVDEKVRYSDAELAEFKELILGKLEKAKTDLDLIKSAYLNDLNNGTDDTSPTFKAFEEGSETMSKEANSQLAIRQEKFIRDLKNALKDAILDGVIPNERDAALDFLNTKAKELN